MRKSLLLLVFISTNLYLFAQDKIILKTNEEIKGKILEITTSEIKYKKFENMNGPVYTILKSDAAMVQYENGSKDIFNKDLAPAENLNKAISIKSMDLTKKGNKVYIEYPDQASHAGEKYFVRALNKWGYWNIVTEEKDADFVIEFNIKKGYIKKAWVILKTKDNKQLLESDVFKGHMTIFTGYNAFKGAAKKVVKKYLKQKFY